MHVPRKRFGQHFLSDQVVIQKIMAAIAPTTKDHLVEIGPGQGALTLPMLKLVGQLDVIELDRDLIPDLQARAEHYGKLNIYAADALNFDFSTLKKDERLLRIFGNLPYNISTPLLFHLLESASLISDMTFMLQKEVGHRLAAKPGGKDYGRLSVMAQYHCRIHLLFDVPASSFYPPPKVESCMITLAPHAKPTIVADDYDYFALVVKEAFNHRRKTLRNSLRNLIDEKIWAELAILPTLRAENLSVVDYVNISNAAKLL